MSYTIISRDEFLKLEKFGQIHINENYVFDDKNKDNSIKKLLSFLPYDDEYGYLILEFIKEEENNFFNQKVAVEVSIKNILNIYCLSENGLNFYKTKFNPKIKFKLYSKYEAIEEVNIYKSIEDKTKGFKVLFEIFNFSELEDKYNNDYIKRLINYKNSNYLKQSYDNFYFDMFSYERKNNFSKEDIGFFYDLRVMKKLEKRDNIEIFLSGNLKGIQKPEDINIKDKSLFDIITDTINSINKTDKKSNEKKEEIINNLVTGAIFLKSQKLLDPEKRENSYWILFVELINRFKHDFEEQTKIALYYIGVHLGYKYLYEDYYNFLDLSIFNDNNEITLESTNNEEKLQLELKELKNENNDLLEKVSQLEDINHQNNQIKSENFEIEVPSKDSNSSQLESINYLEKIKIELEEELKIKTDEFEKQKANSEELLKEIQLLKSKEETQSTNSEKTSELSQKLDDNQENATFEPNKRNNLLLNDCTTVGFEELMSWELTPLIEFAFARKLNGLKKGELKKKYTKDNKEELCKAIVDYKTLIS
ncbi:MAG: hypothetical protein U9N59_07620 [Campylobacterota bacterium]|nr:hypothetical protein [Campylobacterota bacterium]